ncbi:Multisubstrate pseudouridine synthase 7 [Tetrabaena socialis]|uniref:Multisubstrate pseudouridine synthase 7 n=1 Tax=Tetrabaena socialis TaxID=47790 RepID=A0A2J8AI35_9CHLO|nr:Multisubstrate pseudouridine synthase 7 [Tetrabaena socialis]|eukprot:PNH12179.1 Multisubstrate pseudouridine synthase 7 [Tetrabaena socialis]
MQAGESEQAASTLRPLQAHVAAACESVGRRGFLNYFGLQRFGSGGAPTHVVGRALLSGDYERAARLVLRGRPDERPDIAAARRLFTEGGDARVGAGRAATAGGLGVSGGAYGLSALESAPAPMAGQQALGLS